MRRGGWGERLTCHSKPLSICYLRFSYPLTSRHRSMSLKLIESETKRFLATSTPEVLCIRGHWGVGKTYAWRSHLTGAANGNKLGHSSYSYVSLFGLNSLDDLRFAIFENTVSKNQIQIGPNVDTFSDLLESRFKLAKKGRPLIDLLAAAFNKSSVRDVIYRTAFLAVRNQLICIDDLERAGSGLTPRDVLGLASFLKEERNCSVVLLLNDEQLTTDNKSDFALQVEKVADTSIRFDITPSEAALIGIPSNHGRNSFIRERIEQLKITNIRTIKKIERLANRLIKALDGLNDTVIEQAITTAALAQWSANHPGTAPDRSFLVDYNIVSSSMDSKKDLERPVWFRTLQDYNYSATDSLDLIIINSAYDGYLDEEQLIFEAEKLNNSAQNSIRENEFFIAWDQLYHGSLSVDDNEFLDYLYWAATKNADNISLGNMNSTITMLRSCGRSEQATQLINDYVKINKDKGFEFFNIKNSRFMGEDKLDDELRAAFASELETITDDRSPLDVMRNIAENQRWNDRDLKLISNLNSDELQNYLEQLKGNETGRVVDLLLLIGRSGQKYSEAILGITTSALKQIAAKSPLRARKVARFGIELDQPPGGA